MAERVPFDPFNSPEQAAQDVVLELCRTGAFGVGSGQNLMGRDDGEDLAEAVSAFHEKLTAYYKSLKSR
ncbi:hypothetical protein [Modicisalibacter sp. MOD 31.J]|uniref:hypothetical protein n=1 Tax=Modicisalibacter sp. MOD 31.J TaxID=2831897 RepID=UPI001CCEF722|nr:hypothetical protein [Modicisalibacter sp. MOD 31.J]MBZ9576748.1 hypothetical protein [Modicisalibacter sp. MOD 31.J]